MGPRQRDVKSIQEIVHPRVGRDRPSGRVEYSEEGNTMKLQVYALALCAALSAPLAAQEVNTNELGENGWY